MEVTLDKIELVKDRTGVSYKDAKDALEAADGSVVDAIIQIEENIDSSGVRTAKEQGTAILDSVKELLRKGNESRLVVKDRAEKQLINIPVNAGLLGAVIAPTAALAGTVACIGFKCNVEVVKYDGTIIDVSERASDFASKAKEKAADFGEKFKDKAGDFYENAKEKADDFKDRAEDRFDEFKDKAEDRFGDKFDDFKERAKEKAGDAIDAAREKAADLKERATDALNRAEEAAGDVMPEGSEA